MVSEAANIFCRYTDANVWPSHLSGSFSDPLKGYDLKFDIFALRCMIMGTFSWSQ